MGRPSFLIAAAASVVLVLGCVQQVDLRSPPSSDLPDVGFIDGAPDANAPDALVPRDALVEDADPPDRREPAPDATAGGDGDANRLDAEPTRMDAVGEDALVRPCVAEGHDCLENAAMPGTCPEGRQMFPASCLSEMLACCGPP